MRPVNKQSSIVFTIARAQLAFSLVLAMAGAVALASGDQTSGQPAQEPAATISGQFGGTLRGLTVVGDKGYATIGLRFVMLDLADPLKPSPVGYSQPLPDVANDIAVAGDYAYLALKSGGLATIDVAKPSRPALVSRIPDEDERSLIGIAVAGTRLTVISSSKKLYVYDIAEPDLPTALGQLELRGQSSPTHVKVRGQYAFVARFAFNPSIDVIDLADPEKPYVARTVDLDWNPYDLELDGDRLVIVGFHDLTVFDIADPLLIHAAGTIRVTAADPASKEALRTVAVAGNRIIVAGYDGQQHDPKGRAWILDASSPDQMRILGTMDLPRAIGHLSTHDRFDLDL